MFGPEYPKIQTLFKRDERNIIIPGEWTTDEFEYLADRPWRWTEKVDGTNIRVHWNGVEVTIGGRTDKATIPTFLFEAIKWLIDSPLWKERFPDHLEVTLYGEGYGSRIQKGRQYREDPALILFDVRIGHWWLKPDAVEEIAGHFGLPIVPLMGEGSLRETVALIRTGELKSMWPNAKLEGLVGTPAVPLSTRSGQRIITKIKVKDFEDFRNGA